jgi:hypothetical protein
MRPKKVYNEPERLEEWSRLGKLKRFEGSILDRNERPEAETEVRGPFGRAQPNEHIVDQ